MDSKPFSRSRLTSIYDLTVVVALLTVGVFVATCKGGGGGGPNGEVIVDTTVYGRVLSAGDELPMEGVTVTVAS